MSRRAMAAATSSLRRSSCAYDTAHPSAATSAGASPNRRAASRVMAGSTREAYERALPSPNLTGRQVPQYPRSVDLTPSADAEAFRKEVRDYFDDALSGEFAAIRNRGGPGDEHALVEERMAWERKLGADGWTCVGWPSEHGGRGLSMAEQIVYHEEYARAGGPGRVGIVGEGLLGPTLIHYGSEEQQRRFLPGIVAGTEFWCQGYSEPNAG